MGKRAAAVTTSPRKAARNDECKPVLELLGLLEAEALPEAAREMLLQVAPFALRTHSESRHEFQTQMIDHVAELFAAHVKHCEAGIQTAEAAVAAVHQEKAAAEATIEQAKQVAADEAQKRDSKNADMEAANKAFDAAAAAHKTAQEHENALEGELAQASTKKVTLEVIVSEKLAPLKEGNYPGNQWRQRNKLIDEFMKDLTGLDAQESLRAGVEAALKTKPAERGPFAGKCVEACEGFLAEKIKELAAVEAGGEAEKAARAEAVAQAAGAEKATKEVYDARVAEFIALDNTVLEKNTAVSELAEAIEKAAERLSERTAARDAEVAKLEMVQHQVSEFEGLKARKAPEQVPAEQADA